MLAHPGPDGRHERIERLAAMGLDGVEVIHPSHSAEDRARLLALTKHLNLVPSGGHQVTEVEGPISSLFSLPYC